MPSKSLLIPFSLAASLLLSALPRAHAATTGSTGDGQPIDNSQPSLAMNYLIRLDGAPGQVGEVLPFAGAFAPAGYAFPQGQLLSIDQFPNLFGELGATYGGDGANTFALPDLRGRTPIQRGQGDGLTNRPIGTSVGTDAVTMGLSNLPSHHHNIPGGTISGPAGASVPLNNEQPSLAMNYAIALDANFPSDTVANPPTWTGQVRLFAGATTPSGYASADGQLVPVNNNLALFQQLGTTYGGNGGSTFALPDLRGRAVIHNGSADGVNTHALGDKVGSETVALNDSQLPAHTHSMAAPAGATLSDGGGQPFSNMEPSIALNYIICIQGNFPSANSGANEPFLGELALFAGSVAPRNWAFADGQTVPVSQYTDLFAILGTTYGGNGANTFQLPDLQSRTIVGAGQGPGLTNRVRGQSYGEENTTLTVSQLPPHTHTYATFDGDYNANGFVDGADFLNWQRGFGVAFPATHSQGDGDFSGDVDNFDRQIWSAQFGAAPPPPALPVPEPTAYYLLATAAAATLLRRFGA